MKTTLLVFTPIFFAIMFVNQIFYGGCIEYYCLKAAFPKVLVLSIIITAVFRPLTSAGAKHKRIDRHQGHSHKNQLNSEMQRDEAIVVGMNSP